jgi:hypothetical protein
MPLVRFEVVVPVFEKEKTVHAFDRSANVIDSCYNKGSVV